jgi:acetolactate synthase regulatory subunit
MNRIAPQVIMIVEIFVPQDQAMNALTDQFSHAMFDVALVSVVNETAGDIS